MLQRNLNLQHKLNDYLFIFNLLRALKHHSSCLLKVRQSKKISEQHHLDKRSALNNLLQLMTSSKL